MIQEFNKLIIELLRNCRQRRLDIDAALNVGGLALDSCVSELEFCSNAASLLCFSTVRSSLILCHSNYGVGWRTYLCRRLFYLSKANILFIPLIWRATARNVPSTLIIITTWWLVVVAMCAHRNDYYSFIEIISLFCGFCFNTLTVAV